MSVKRFFAADAHAAMKAVRNAFGDDAIIVANRETADGVEILATDSFDDLLDAKNIETAAENLDSDTPGADNKASNATSAGTQTTVYEPAAKPQKPAAKSKRAPRKKPAAAKAALPVEPETDTTAAPQNVSSNDMKREILELRSMLEGMAHSNSIATTKNVSQLGISGKLLAAGFSADLVRDLMDKIASIKKPDQAVKKVQSLLEKQIPVQRTDYISDGGVVYFHGLAGAGKSTALCKLAAQFLAQESSSKLALINHQTNSIGNSDLLTSVGTLLGVPVHHTDNDADLSHAIRQLRRKHLILIDTDALDLQSLRSPETLTGFNHKGRRLEHCLVLPANLQSSVMDHTLSCLSQSPVESLILSRMDNTLQYGIALDSLIKSTMKLSYWSDSPKIHQPLCAVKPALLIGHILKTQNPAPPTIINKMPDNTMGSSAITEDSLSSIPFG